MYRYRKKTTSLIFGICLVLGIIMFGVFGATFAYFQIDEYVEQTYTLGSVGAYWCQGVDDTVVSTTEEIELNAESALVRGDEAGVDITGGMLSIKATNDSGYEYVRIRYTAYVDGVEVSAITDNLRLRKYETDISAYVALGADYTANTNYNSPWRSGGDGWYYYSTEPIAGGYSSVPVCNNIMLVELDQSYLSKQLQIKLEFETIQAENNAVEAVWGANAKTALGIA